ncbi:MAG: hypothetical protein ACRC1Z_06035 [Waterburya sp.]
MANPNPKTEHLNRFPRMPGADEPCARKPVQVKIPQSQYEQWMTLPVDLRNQVLREAIQKTLEKQSPLTA